MTWIPQSCFSTEPFLAFNLPTGLVFEVQCKAILKVLEMEEVSTSRTGTNSLDQRLDLQCIEEDSVQTSTTPFPHDDHTFPSSYNRTTRPSYSGSDPLLISLPEPDDQVQKISLESPVERKEILQLHPDSTVPVIFDGVLEIAMELKLITPSQLRAFQRHCE